MFWRKPLAYAVGWVAVWALGMAFRLPGLDRRPMHPDEANQAWKTGLLWQTGHYRYDPAEHHGPTLYYLTLPVLWLAGPGDFAQTGEIHYRLLTALAGGFVVWAVLLFRRVLGAGAVLLSAALTAFSPVMVFYSRYYIQEILLVLFTLGFLVCLGRWRQSQTVGGAAYWSALAGGCLGLMAATKETWILSWAAMLVAGLLELVWASCLGRRKPMAILLGLQSDPQRTNYPPGLAKWGLLGGMGLLIAFGVAWILYTHGGAHPEGFRDAWAAYQVYLHRGLDAGPHRHPPFFYLERLLAYRAKGVFWTEGFILLLAAVGIGWAFWPWPRPGARDAPLQNSADKAFVRFLSFYTVGLTVLYSAIPYKTPWCAMQFWQGWILLAGVGGNWLISWAWRLPSRLFSWVAVAGMALVLVGGGGHLLWQSWQVNFNPRLFANGEQNPWVYAHTAPHILRLADRMEQFAAVATEGHRMLVHVIVPDNYWPLPWYLRRFDQERVGYWENLEAWAACCHRLPPPHVLIVQAEIADQLQPHLQASYNSQMLFRLRPEVFVRVYVRQDLWEAFLRRLGSGGQ
ncbi:MAG: TIGR03663 family protein [Thermoguttaceae bacterium]|nr:TIGR03663 family protein [Thermoguttaceae bacterium]MDW8039673.1 TIGR03663 family protein [Thermoguttaceae bacterium]